MPSNTQYLNDEHMQLYTWSGAGTGAGCVIPQKSRRTHAWHASSAVLAVLTTLLLLNGCDNKGPAEQAGAQVDQAAQDMKANGTAEDNATQAGPAQEAGETIEHVGEELQKP